VRSRAIASGRLLSLRPLCIRTGRAPKRKLVDVC
jgi:hypothetical protein